MVFTAVIKAHVFLPAVVLADGSYLRYPKFGFVLFFPLISSIALSFLLKLFFPS